MDGASAADSDHSMSWEDFFGSTTDLTPTLIGIYDSLLEPDKSLKPEVSRFDFTPKDARNDPPNQKPEPTSVAMMEETNDNVNTKHPPKENTKPSGLATINKSSLYTLKPKLDSDKIGAISDITSSDTVHNQRTLKTESKPSEVSFDNLSSNVKRMISSVDTATANPSKFQKKTLTTIRSSGRGRSNIPLVGATSKIAQSRVEILPTVDIYDQPCGVNNLKKPEESPSKTLKPHFKLDIQETYDVPTNNTPVHKEPEKNTAFESLSLPYIDQSIELSNSTDREFDTKVSSKDTTPEKSAKTLLPDKSPLRQPKLPTTTNSLSRKDSPGKQLPKSVPYPDLMGSVGNLKSGPEKEVRLVPPIVEVSRPLSMSSIVSSSSSSSGVQNKGVNSAYLASIESLDDHSDADMVSGNGSNNFVKGAGVSEEGTLPRERELSQLDRVCAEILHTEKVYVHDLQQVVEGYLHVWRREETFSEQDLTALFNNIEDIYNFNRQFCAELHSCQLDARGIARCFVAHIHGFQIYTSYCTGYPNTMERLAVLASKPAFRDRQVALSHPLPLASYLLKPVQRILLYHLLLQKVVKQSVTGETQYALLQMTRIAQHIDEMKRRHEHRVRVQEIQSLLYGWSGPDLTTYGELCAEGTFRVFGARAVRHVFLFDKMLLVTKSREDGILAYKSHVMCNNLMLVESIEGAPLSFHVIPWDAPRQLLTLQARDKRHKREWTLLLKRVILENYNAVIPSHARQLLMELGQNKTDDDILAEKSHNLITQASMRKQLSAPEYLEKRKLEKDRRKSIENTRGRAKKGNRKYTVPLKSCDCAQVSSEKGIDYTCEICYIDLCSDCEVEVGKSKDFDDQCIDCDRLNYLGVGSVDNLVRKTDSDFKSSVESVSKDAGKFLKAGYHSDPNADEKSLTDANSLIDIRSINKTCLKCSLIKENIATTDNFRSRCVDVDRHKDMLRSKSRDDPQRSRLSKIGTWRRKSEPNRQQVALVVKRSQEGIEKGMEKCEFLCRNCGANKINRHDKHEEVVMSDPELDDRKRASIAQNLEIKMYNTKHIPKKISKLKKNRAKGRNTDTTAKFYADLSKDEFTKNVLHITESNDSLNIETTKSEDIKESTDIKPSLSKDESIDEETYKKLIEKTDSFKKNELEKVKFLNKQKVINENSPGDEKGEEIDEKTQDAEALENTEDAEQPLEHIISQLLLQNREFQKILKKQQARSSQKRHQMLLKSHSYPEQSPKSPTRKNSEGVIERPLSPPKEIEALEEDHIYETLRVVDRVEETLHTLDTKSKSIQHRNSRHSRIPSPTLNSRPKSPQNTNLENISNAPPDSDYVYLTFNKLQDNIEGIYDVPIKSPEKVANKQKDKYDYVTMQNQSSPIKHTVDIYDNVLPITKLKEAANGNQGDYLPMSPDSKSPKQGGPNTPEKWISDQKEHFNVPRDRKSGSLPRSFQVGSPEDVNLSTFKSKPTGKSYLNRDGKVINSDRPYTIASDQGEIRYENAENYISEESMTIAKMNLKDKTTDLQNISKSTLELEEEIDRCYKNNFEAVNLDTITTENLDVFEPNLNVSATSSCEAYTEKTEVEKAKDIDLIHHPENKIYKPTSNMLSLKNVLSRFKSRPDKSNDNSTDSLEQSPENVKSDAKISPNEKRSGLNPRSYSKNLLQRFRSIIGDEHPDDDSKTKKTLEDIQSSAKTDIKVVITSTESNPTASVATNDALSKSVCETTTLSLSQSEKHNLEILSHSCDNINQQMESHNHKYDRSQSVTVSNTSLSPSKSNSSFQTLNKLPIYMQGSRHLGARIAQSDYVDPKTLISDKAAHKNINILINKNAVRPDSLFSNASFVTSSSEGNTEVLKTENDVSEKTSSIADATISDESYYEKSFEKIEKLLDDDAFRDSAVYSEHEDTVDSKDAKRKNLIKTVTTIEHVKRTSSFKSEQVSIKASVTDIKSNTQSRLSYTSKVINTNHTEPKPKVIEQTKSKTAPPVPIKPKLTHLPTPTGFQSRIINKNIIKTQETTDSTNVSSFKRNISMRYVKPDKIKDTSEGNSEKVEAKPPTDSSEVKTKAVEVTKTTPKDTVTDTPQLKRNTLDRASLDSAIRKVKPTVEGHTKSVLERRMEIESLTKAKFKPTPITKKPSQIAKPKGTTSKVTPYERSTSEFAKTELKCSTSTEKPNIPIEITSAESEDQKGGSWVKTVVNKFQ